ncbi:hypothetical protein KA093_00110 [Candidatus Saccharibacteria bacterium]|nr:hypothetical protein [Candidatus Saccharibacteria bacterium]
MAFDPFVVQIDTPVPKKDLHRHLPTLGPRGTKILIAIAAGLMIISMITFAIFSVLTTDKKFTASHGLDANEVEALQQAEKSQAALPGGNVAQGTGGTSGTNAPVVTLTADPASVIQGGKSRLKWSVTNNPTECKASDDWSGDKKSSGEEDTASLDKVQTYLFTLTCKTATGTGFATVSVGSTAQGGTGNIITRPTVTLAANPSSIYTGDSSTLVWSVTNNPTSCTASGDWSGAKSTSGPAGTGALATAKTYTYTLTCQNSAGSGYATATVKVEAPPPDMPIVTIASNPVGPVTPGTSVTLTWSVSNNPTSCTASGDWTGEKNASGSQAMGALSTIKTYLFTMTCGNGAGSSFDTAAVAVIPNVPIVSISVNPSSMYSGSSATISWSATNSPTSCTASGSWSGAKATSGTQSTGALGAGTYSYSLLCTNQGGDSAVATATVSVTLPPAPVVSLSANPISTTSGGSSNLTWSATNSPTNCTASGDWTGTKGASGTQSTGTLSTVRTYTYTLACSNAGGSDTASTSVSVSSGTTTSPPAVSISASPPSIGTGSSSTLSWSATNSPTSCTATGAWSGAKSASGSQSTGTMSTAGTFTYTLSCSNSAGSGTASATVTVIATPVVSISVSPTSITTGSSSTITWSVTNSPTSCTASGSWSGSKAASGSQSTGTMSTAGSYTYTLSCTNAGGTTSNAATLTVTNPAPVYCGGLTPCYGPADLAAHASVGNCWGWNGSWVINITSFRPSHKGGIKAGSTSTLENASATCNHNINAILRGTASIPGYQDNGGNTTHGHGSSTINNSAGSLLTGYRAGYYDATKP